MDNLAADFTIENNNPFEVEYELSENKGFDCSFSIFAAPDISHLATKEELQETAKILNERIDNEVDTLNSRINTMVQEIEGSELIGVSREGQTVTITSQTFVFEQGIPATEWVINHNLNKRPSIELVYSNGQRFEAYKEYTSDNQVIVRLDSAATGFAYLN